MGQNDYIVETKKRHGFVTFWLWFGIIVNIINTPLTIISYQNIINYVNTQISTIAEGVDFTAYKESIGFHIILLQIMIAIAGICMVVFYSILLNWKKSGFWGLITTAIIAAIINVFLLNCLKDDFTNIGLVYNYNPIKQFITTPISILITWAILQLKRDGVSCWNQLE